MVPSQHSVLKGAFEWIAVVAIALVTTFLIRSFGLAMVSVYPLWKADNYPGQSRRGQDLLCHAPGEDWPDGRCFSYSF